MSGLLIFIIIVILLVIVHVIVIQFFPNFGNKANGLLSDARAKIPTKVSSVKVPSVTSSQTQETNEKIALLQEKLRTGTVT